MLSTVQLIVHMISHDPCSSNRIVVLTMQSEGEAAIARGRYVDANLAKLIR